MLKSLLVYVLDVKTKIFSSVLSLRYKNVATYICMCVYTLYIKIHICFIVYIIKIHAFPAFVGTIATCTNVPK